MPTTRNAPASTPRTAVPWLVRIVVLGAFAATVWFALPRAWHVIATRFGLESRDAHALAAGPLVLTDRLAPIELPYWLHGEILRAVLSDFEPRLRGGVRLMDEVAATDLQARLRESPFVTSATLERQFPDRFRVHVDLRRPVAQFVDGANTVAWFDRDGVALPAAAVIATELPRIALEGAVPGFDAASLRAGEPAQDQRIRAACAVADEWRECVVAAVPDAPRLCAIDPRNYGFQFVADARYAQVLIALANADGGVAWFHHGPARSEGGAVDPSTRVAVLRAILAEHPGLVGIEGGDLRMLNLWRNYLVPGDGSGRR